MSLFDAFEWAMDKALSRAEDKHLNPPSARLIACQYCNATGTFEDQDCEICEATGYIEEPQEWAEKDMYWETKYDEQREKECDK